jgi:TPR repeat protein
MKNIIFLISTLLLIFSFGCVSQTPGDAALRGGHPNAAADLYSQGAEQGDATAALRLGLLIDQGTVSQKDYGDAGIWFKKACELGSLPGCHNAAVAYEYGKNGFEKDFNQARHYYQIAAEKGYMQSQYNLGSLYSNNYITPPNNVEGYMWMAIAEKSAMQCRQEQLCQWILNDPPGHRKNLQERLTTEELQKTESLASDWISKNKR